MGVALPALQGADEQAFRAINGLGQGPEWLYQTLDPHSRNYAILLGIALVAAMFFRRARYVAGAGVAVLLAAFGSDLVLEPFQILFDRPRPRRRSAPRRRSSTAARGRTSRASPAVTSW